ncbi:hypothetical protein [Heyndrickxia oleronia]|uniref:Uncharacterized protein n=1 Tax=Heyndrickxia oleronia TaxID=38875 RepID=A0AAW6SQV6_9BACI|nr:hypothetical protein [Heyndrickxia oleronia]MDH5160603.1 hypothetical protein [Heyndrickxia oleronia]
MRINLSLGGSYFVTETDTIPIEGSVINADTHKGIGKYIVDSVQTSFTAVHEDSTNKIGNLILTPTVTVVCKKA